MFIDKKRHPVIDWLYDFLCLCRCMISSMISQYYLSFQPFKIFFHHSHYRTIETMRKQDVCLKSVNTFFEFPYPREIQRTFYINKGYTDFLQRFNMTSMLLSK